MLWEISCNTCANTFIKTSNAKTLPKVRCFKCKSKNTVKIRLGHSPERDNYGKRNK